MRATFCIGFGVVQRLAGDWSSSGRNFGVRDETEKLCLCSKRLKRHRGRGENPATSRMIPVDPACLDRVVRDAGGGERVSAEYP